MTVPEAADKLFRPSALPDEWDDYQQGDARRTAIVLKELSFAAGQQEEGFDGYELASVIWRNAKIPDCLREAERIAETVEELYD